MLLEKWLHSFKVGNWGVEGIATATIFCLVTCSLILSHKKKGTGLYLTGLLYPSAQAAQRGTKTGNQMFVTAYRREVTPEMCADHDRALVAQFLHRLSCEAQWCSAHAGLLSPVIYAFVKTKMSSQFILLCLCGWKETTSPLPMPYESGYFSSLIWVWTGLAKCFLRSAALFLLLFWGLKRFSVNSMEQSFKLHIMSIHFKSILICFRSALCFLCSGLTILRGIQLWWCQVCPL